MTGTKGRSGGKREGAGAKPGTSGGIRPGAGRPVKTFTITIGEKFYTGLQNGGTWTVTALDRKHITFADQNGNEIKLVR